MSGLNVFFFDGSGSLTEAPRAPITKTPKSALFQRQAISVPNIVVPERSYLGSTLKLLLGLKVHTSTGNPIRPSGQSTTKSDRSASRHHYLC